MTGRQRKWAKLAAVGSIAGLAMLLLFRSVPLAAGSATFVVVALIVLKHLALGLIVASPLAALLNALGEKIRPHCPFAKP